MKENLCEEVGAMLLEKGITFSCAESCTGGLFAGAMTDIVGISDVFDRGIVTYSNRAKVEELGVSQSTLNSFGAVSWQIALEMAEGICRVAGTRLGVSVTGIAGPGGATEGKPVGLIYIGICLDGESRYRELQTGSDDRQANRKCAVQCMLEEVRSAIEK